MSKQEVNQIFKDKDKNGSGSIDYREFVISLADRKKLYEREKIKGNILLTLIITMNLIIPQNNSFYISQ